MSLTAVATQKWGQQHRSMPDWVGHYMATKYKPSRHAVIDALNALSPFESLVELGCNAGPMLSLIHDTYPTVSLSGVDTNAFAVEACGRNLPTARVILDDVMHWLPEQNPESTDVLLTYYTLAYIAPEDLPAILWQMGRVTRRGLVLCEPLATADEPPGLVYEYPEWRHDYQRLLRDVGLAGITQRLPIPEGHLNGIVVVHRGDSPQ